MTYRVIVDGNSGDGFRYRIEDMYEGEICKHSEGLLSDRGSGVSGLRKKLKEMLAACDKPTLAVKTELVEVDTE